MKICLVSNLFPPLVHGGAEIYVGRLAAALAQEHGVVVISSEAGAHLKPRRETGPDGIVTYRLAPLNVGHLTNLPHHLIPQAAFRAIDFYHPQIAATVRAIIVRERPDIVHIHNWVGLSLAAVLSSVNSGRFDRVPVAMTLHDYGLCCAYADLRHPDGRGCPPRLPCRVLSAINRPLTDSVGLVLSPSQYVLDLHRRRGFFSRADTQVLPYGLPQKFQLPGLRNGDGLKSTFDVLFLGRVQGHKGTDLLVRAFRALPDPALRLHVAGVGPMLPECRRLAEGDSRISFHGFVSGETRQALLDRADCFVLPSRWPDNYPLSIQEAFQAGPVVIASRIGGIPEMVRDGVNGLLVEAHDEAAIGHAIERLRQSPVLLAGLRAEAAKTAHLYDMAFHTAHVTQAYRRLIAANRVHPFSRKAA